MAIELGTHLGPYEVLAVIGAGGMGEVYKARDTRLNRDVALKVLPEVLSRDTQRMARFEREARILASLNHPNIAAIYGLEESGPIRALVMELVEGPTLADHIRSGPIPLDEALPIARQIADALEYAHDKNIIHRDLKPPNIKVTVDGTVKVLDFGLAKAMSEDLSETDVSNSPTLSMAATRPGVILGTAAYMSPEQARGKAVDRRTDIWAFGCVVYEMLTGKQTFQGEDVADILAAVVRADPDWGPLPVETPPNIRTLLRRCLQKDKNQRMRDAGDARIEIQEELASIGDGGSQAARAPVVTQPKSRERVLWFSVTLFLLATLLAGGFAYWRRAPQEAQAVRFFIAPPETWTLPQQITPSNTSAAPLAVSPDGRRIAFIANSPDGKSSLWVRALETLSAQALAETDGAYSPFWSPDGRFLAFFADGKLKKVDISGGPPITLCDAPGAAGGAWSREGVIIFATNSSTIPLQRVSASGGVPVAAETIGQDSGTGTQLRPSFLPDGRHFLFRAGSAGGRLSIYLGSLDSTERKLLLQTDATPVIYSQGHLLFLRESTLMAQPFDAQRLVLTGEAFPIAEGIKTSLTANPNAYFSASENGVLAYQPSAGDGGYNLTWFDRNGKQIGVLGDPALYDDLEFSPDGKRVAASRLDRTTQDIWLYDVTRGVRTRFTFGPARQLAPIWSPDGSRVVFASSRKGHYDLYQKASSGTGSEEVLLEDNNSKYPWSWSPDGRFILYNTGGGATRVDLFVLPLTGDRKPFPFLNTKFDEWLGKFSPDGRWVAYVSDESGKNEVYVAPFPGPGGKWQISTGGGNYPRWRRDGAEIVYLALDNKLMSAAVNGKGPIFEVGAIKPLFPVRSIAGQRYLYDMSADGQRFLVNTIVEQQSVAQITVLLNWTAALKK